MIDNVVGYIRVSTREQTESGLSLSAQERRIIQYCEYKSLNLIKIIRDENVSAATSLASRVGGSELIKLTHTKKFGVVAIKLDRLFRDAHDCLGVTKDWASRGISLHLMDLGVDTNTAMGRAFLTNAATYAELEKNLISERTKEALNQIKIEGGLLGAPSFGWEYVEAPDKDGARVAVPIAAELRVVYTCKAMRSAGYTFRQIADKLNADGVPTKRGKKWHASSVRNCCAQDKKVEKA